MIITTTSQGNPRVLFLQNSRIAAFPRQFGWNQSVVLIVIVIPDSGRKLWDALLRARGEKGNSHELHKNRKLESFVGETSYPVGSYSPAKVVPNVIKTKLEHPPVFPVTGVLPGPGVNANSFPVIPAVHNARVLTRERRNCLSPQENVFPSNVTHEILYQGGVEVYFDLSVVYFLRGRPNSLETGRMAFKLFNPSFCYHFFPRSRRQANRAKTRVINVEKDESNNFRDTFKPRESIQCVLPHQNSW